MYFKFFLRFIFALNFNFVVSTKNINTSTGGLLIDFQFPFHDLTDTELSRTTGSWIYRSNDRLKGKSDMYKDILETPDKNDPSEYLYETRSESKYFSIKNQVSFSTRLQNRKVFHCCIVTHVVWVKMYLYYMTFY